eukprot:CAMPEP_0183776712 /NCGR_PEP_ID=MMETSP0739-20130205/47436_1 /TAXON_ID=385413 /ORGANISM="Thalassiosira miniscula, Strain CCMP1093" /LENGTH=80 /DNA_ID=CAMNT_0026018647 /DNA_START=1 /DNA_END=239 /DNA_ORIENTATION=+
MSDMCCRGVLGAADTAAAGDAAGVAAGAAVDSAGSDSLGSSSYFPAIMDCIRLLRSWPDRDLSRTTAWMARRFRRAASSS